MNENGISNRTIALIDILGFKSLIDDNIFPLQHIINSYEDFQEAIIKELEKKDDCDWPSYYIVCKRYIFSDSIIIVSPNDSLIACESLLFETRTIMQHLIIRGFMVRAAITYGELYINHEKNIFLGKPLNKAYNLEKLQEWIGGIIDESVENKFPEIFAKPIKNLEINGQIIKQYSNFDCIRYKPPLKKGVKKILYSINLLNQFPVNLIRKSILDAKKIIRSDKPSEIKKIRRKYSNTIAYLNYLTSIIELIDGSPTYYHRYHYENDKYSIDPSQ